VETQCWTRVTEGENLRSKSQCVKVAGNENNRFWCIYYLRQKWINLRQTKTKMITDPFYMSSTH